MHVSAVRFNAVHRDSDSETGIFYHDLGHDVWAASLLERAPKDRNSLSVIGLIAAKGQSPDEALRSFPDHFQSNPEFWNALHKVLKEQIPHDDILQFEADMRRDGWAHLCGTHLADTDARHMAMPGRISPPEAIFGSVAFTDAKLDPETYERNETYRFAVKNDGPMKLRENWLKAIRDYIENHE